MTNKSENPSAFPAISGLSNQEGSYYVPGMSLRDYFAAKAMAGLCACPNVKTDEPTLAKASYMVADAMLKEREK